MSQVSSLEQWNSDIPSLHIKSGIKVKKEIEYTSAPSDIKETIVA